MAYSRAAGILGALGAYAMMGAEQRDAYLAECRELVVGQILRWTDDQPGMLRDAVLDYPLRVAKGLRPALCIAACRAQGGSLEGVLPSAAVLELYHNAFLIHDDVEDGSELRRERPTLHAEVGQANAINVGDAMLAMALEPLLDNMAVLDVGRAIRVLEVVSRMARETTEGQALELDWIRVGRWDVGSDEYVTMVTKKTSWYTFVAPLLIGGIVAEASADWLGEAEAFGLELGVAFQIRDDVLNLKHPAAEIGKEACGDLWEGKRTLILTHFFERASSVARTRAKQILGKRRPTAGSLLPGWALAALRDFAARGRQRWPGIDAELADALESARMCSEKSASEVDELRAMLDATGSIGFAEAEAERHASLAFERWQRLGDALTPGVHRDLLESLIFYVAARRH